jgi:hypothetical protein
MRLAHPGGVGKKREKRGGYGASKASDACLGYGKKRVMDSLVLLLEWWSYVVVDE